MKNIRWPEMVIIVKMTENHTWDLTQLDNPELAAVGVYIHTREQDIRV